jgi:hypothetical protein
MENGSGFPYQRQSPAGGIAKENGRGVSTGFFVGVLILALCTFIGLVLAAVIAVVAGLGLYAENAKLRSDVEALTDRVEYLNDEAMRLWIADDMRLNGVTNEFCTDDVVFYEDDVVILNAVVQLEYDDHYLGGGRFDISDADLQDKLNEYVREFELSYNSGKPDGMTDFGDLELQIFVYGFDLATYKDGVLTLD